MFILFSQRKMHFLQIIISNRSKKLNYLQFFLDICLFNNDVLIENFFDSTLPYSPLRVGDYSLAAIAWKDWQNR
jgi:hypothetical protein